MNHDTCLICAFTVTNLVSMKYNCVHNILLEHSLSMCLHGTHITAAPLNRNVLPLGCIDCSTKALLRTSDHYADCCHFISISHLQ